MTYRILAAVAAAALLSSVAVANDDDESRSSGATFKSLDADRDERLSLNEVSSDEALAQHFAALDRNSDGYLTKREYSSHTKDNKDMGKDIDQPERKPY